MGLAVFFKGENENKREGNSSFGGFTMAPIGCFRFLMCEGNDFLTWIHDLATYIHPWSFLGFLYRRSRFLSLFEEIARGSLEPLKLES